MQMRTREDGTTYIESSRTIYIAFGEAPVGRGTELTSLLNSFDERLRDGAPTARVAAVFAVEHRRHAEHAVSLIQEFERLTGEECGAEVLGVTVPGQSQSIAVASSLAILLSSLGFTGVGSASVD